jgi:transitional endoplasmic reticulum ATPase
MVIKNNKENGNNIGDVLLHPEELRVKPSEYYTHPKLLEDFEDLKTVILNSQTFGSEMGARNYVFTGPPGVGKTLGAQVIAVDLGIPFYDITSFVKGQSMAIPQVFNELRVAAEKNRKTNGKGIIAFIDEIEGLASRDNIVDPMQYQSMTQVLSQLDGVSNNDGIFIIGATNRQNDLDEAIRSRFGEEIEFLPPDTRGRYEILKIHTDGKGGHKFVVPDELVHTLSEKSYGYVGRDLKSLLNKAFVHAQRRKTTDVIMEDLEYGLRKVKPSAIKDMPFVEPHVKLADIVGYEDHKAMLKSIIEKSNESVMLFFGPKGTGKTYAAEALAGDFGYNYILVKGSELENMFVGKTKDNTEKIIKRAKQLSPCIVCFDEISSFVERKGTMSHKDSQTGYLQSVLSRPPEGVYIIGTDNNPDFLRGPFMDRFIHKLFFGMPSKEEQVALWNMYAPGIDSQALVNMNDKLSCRDIANATKRIRDYGITPSVDAYKKIVECIPKSDENQYKNIIEQIGNGVADYRALKEFHGVKK